MAMHFPAQPMKARTKLSEVVATRKWAGASTQTLAWLGSLLEKEGVDLLEASVSELARGTPVYADANADVLEVQRLMARNHILRLPVVDQGKLLGIIDLVEIALRAEQNP